MFKALVLAILMVANFLMPLGAAEPAPKLLLHFDINKTLITEDIISNKNSDYILSNALALRSIHQWDKAHPPMSYYDYVHLVVAKGDKEKQYELIGGFISFVESSDYPDRDFVIKTYEEAMSKMEGRYLVPSFEKLVKKMEEKNVDFRIILRTFGNDIHKGKIVKEVNQILGNTCIEHIGQIKEGVLTVRGGDQVTQTIQKVDEMYRFFRDSQGHMAIQDDWKTWNNDQERERSGKPFIFDPEDHLALSLFFDDHIILDPNSEFNIIHAIKADGLSLPVKDYLNRNLFAADTIEAVLDEDYFLNLVNYSLSLGSFEMRVDCHF
jgi:hypothetical protein